MRSLRLMLLAMAALLSFGPSLQAQSLGNVATQEKQKRQGRQPSKPITDAELAKPRSRGTVSMTGAGTADPAATEATATEAAASADVAQSTEAPPAPVEGAESPAEQDPAVTAQKTPPPAAPAKKEKTEDEIRAERLGEWRKKLDLAKQTVQIEQQNVDKIQTDLNDISGGVYAPRRNEVLALLDKHKANLAKAQGDVERLEDEGRRNAFR